MIRSATQDCPEIDRTPMAHLTTPSGTTARFLTDFPSAQGVWGFAVSVQSDGKVVAGGQVGGGDTARMGLARYEADGTMDDSFGGDGRSRRTSRPGWTGSTVFRSRLTATSSRPGVPRAGAFSSPSPDISVRSSR